MDQNWITFAESKIEKRTAGRINRDWITWPKLPSTELKADQPTPALEPSSITSSLEGKRAWLPGGKIKPKVEVDAGERAATGETGPATSPGEDPTTFRKHSRRATVIQGDCLDVLSTIPANSIDSIVSDLPAGISFMGKSWDHDRGGRDQWIAWMRPRAEQVLRCAKPGAHALVWAFPRTSHWTMTAFEDAGWEVLNVVHHIFGSGFPKSKNVSLCIDKLSGHPDRGHAIAHASKYRVDGGLQPPGEPLPPYEGKTHAAKQWDGWGTGLKPAVEHWILFRKPLIGSIASNILMYGTGALNIDACRVGTDIISTHHAPKGSFAGGAPNRGSDTSSYATHPGRWPANLVLTNADMLGFPDRKGCSSASTATPEGRIFGGRRSQGSIYDDAGSAARFFNHFQDEALYVYAPKANKADRNGSRHPTIKGQDLMKWLVRLITPPGGTVLDCFAGSGSTGLAACSQGFKCILIEKELEYIEDCRKRLAQWL